MTDRTDLESQQAWAWNQVVKTLDDVFPQWSLQSGAAAEVACNSIRKLVERAKIFQEQAEATIRRSVTGHGEPNSYKSVQEMLADMQKKKIEELEKTIRRLEDQLITHASSDTENASTSLPGISLLRLAQMDVENHVDWLKANGRQSMAASIEIREDRIKELEEVVERLKSGDFTNEEFQNLCHKFDDSDCTKFCDGCDEYQKKLFGKSRTEKLIEEERIARNLASMAAGLISILEEKYTKLDFEYKKLKDLRSNET